MNELPLEPFRLVSPPPATDYEKPKKEEDEGVFGEVVIIPLEFYQIKKRK